MTGPQGGDQSHRAHPDPGEVRAAREALDEVRAQQRVAAQVVRPAPAWAQPLASLLLFAFFAVRDLRTPWLNLTVSFAYAAAALVLVAVVRRHRRGVLHATQFPRAVRVAALTWVVGLAVVIAAAVIVVDVYGERWRGLSTACGLALAALTLGANVWMRRHRVRPAPSAG